MPVVLLSITGVAHLAGDSEIDNMETSSVHKRQLALTSTDALMEDNATYVVIREAGVSNLGKTVSEGGDNMNVISNPLYDESDVSAGLASQACRGP